MPIVSASFPAQTICPICRATLRIREPQWLGRPTNCPECRQLLVLSLQDDGSLLATAQTARANPTPGRPAKAGSFASQPDLGRTGTPATRSGLPETSGNRSTWSWRLGQPLLFGVFAIATTAFAAGTAVVVWSERGNQRGTRVGASTVGASGAAPASSINNTPQTNAQPPALAVAVAVAVAAAEPTAAEPASANGGPATSHEIAPALPPEQNDVLPDAADALIEPLLVPELAVPEQAGPELAISDPNTPPALTIDLPARLQTRLRRFSQPVAVSHADLLEVLTDLLGVPINRTELQAAELERLNQPASTLELSNVSVEQLLETILTPLDLTYRLEPTQLLLIPRTAPSSAER